MKKGNYSRRTIQVKPRILRAPAAPPARDAQASRPAPGLLPAYPADTITPRACGLARARLSPAASGGRPASRGPSCLQSGLLSTRPLPPQLGALCRNGELLASRSVPHRRDPRGQLLLSVTSRRRRCGLPSGHFLPVRKISVSFDQPKSW